MFVFEIFGGELEIIPSDIIDLTGFTDMTYTFALPLVLASFGTSMSISGQMCIRDRCSCGTAAGTSRCCFW